MQTRVVLSFLLLASVACGADATAAAGAIAAPKPSTSASKPVVQPAKSAVKPTTGTSAHKSRAVTAEDMQKVAPSEPGTAVHRVEVPGSE